MFSFKSTFGWYGLFYMVATFSFVSEFIVVIVAVVVVVVVVVIVMMMLMVWL